MAAELGLLPLTHLKKLPKSQDNNIQNQDHHHHQLNPSLIPSSAWMWNPKQTHHQQEEDDSWEVRAFAEDTGNIMGTTWPPRSYTCTFCRREFRSAQALGGHMNVHRRDRARLHQVQPNSINPAGSSSSSSSSASSFLIPTQEFVANGTTLNACTDSSSSSPSTILSISPYPPGNLIPTYSPPVNFPVSQLPEITTNASDHCASNRADQQPLASSTTENGNEEIDLELRLGHGPTPTC
ncbi:hypothetical protein FEM48_Zijuj11G0085900 [Ziziphus jujuba var. spinosa]|uniref:C2H2-type domain-containing protein n=1 Tax=Ziziphus jujuba var. spinosa TaxID=714518 RepID=A0A978UHX1_ZIZJJ|nr:hypothetical protein FEM48_Zijuj11G0085900 [Ziziphus jujuba var. spinosa]